MATLKVPIAVEDHAQGPESADVTLVEYGDYECPYCGQAYPIVQQVQKHFGKRLRLVFRNFPLSEMHPDAEAAAEVAEFAGAQGKFWEMHDKLYENQERLGEALYLDLAEKLKLSTTALHQALEQRTFEARVRADFKGGARSGVNGTPTFFVNGHRHDGSFDFETLVSAIHQPWERRKAPSGGQKLAHLSESTYHVCPGLTMLRKERENVSFLREGH